MSVFQQKLMRAATVLVAGSVVFLGGLLPATPTATCLAGENSVDREEYVAIHAGLILTVTGEEIENGTIVIRDGKIEAVGKKVEVPWGAEVIDAPDLVVMPGMIHPWSREGLPSYRRSGTRTNLTAADELFPEKDAFRDLLEAGFTAVALFPDGDGLPGQASVIRPVDGTAADIVVEKRAYVRIPFTRPSRDKRQVRDAFEKAQAEIEKIEKARQAWEEAQKKKAEEAKKEPEQEKKDNGEKEPPEPKKEPPKKGAPGEQPPREGEEKGKEEKKEPEEFQPPPINPTLEPLVRLLRKEEGARALVETYQAEGYVHFRDILDEFEFEHMYQVQNPKQSFVSAFGGGNDTDAGLIAERMGEEKPKLLLFPEINNLPYTLTRTNLPLQFHRAGCEVSFAPPASTRDAFLRYREKVAEIVLYGYPRAEALKSLTLHPARMLGLGERMGSIEKDRDADLIFLDGDPFEVGTRVVKVMIEGKIVAEPVSKP